MEKNDKIYVSGHAGLVGSALIKALRKNGYNNLTGKTKKELDLRDSSAVRYFFEKEKPDYVFLAAGKVGGIKANNTYRAEFIYDNLMIQTNVIHEAYKSGVKKLLALGSTCIYPREAPQPMKENVMLTSPLEYTNEPYAISKIAAIILSESYNIQYGTNFISVMPTNLYGPNDNYNLENSHVLPALIRKIHIGKCLENNKWDLIRNDLNKYPIEGVSGQSTEKEVLGILSKYGVTKGNGNSSNGVRVEIWGTGAPMREFLWSEEMADACVYLMENVDFKDLIPREEQQWDRIKNTHVNIGTGKTIRIRDLAGLIKDTVGFKGELFFNTDKPDGTLKKLTDVSKLHSLGWHHKIEIDEGVKKIYNWYINGEG